VLWYRKAAKRGYAQAQYKLGLLTARGALPAPAPGAAMPPPTFGGGTAPPAASENPPGPGELDLQGAAKWLKKAADQGYAKAQNKLGVMVREGVRSRATHLHEMTCATSCRRLFPFDR